MVDRSSVIHESGYIRILYDMYQGILPRFYIAHLRRFRHPHVLEIIRFGYFFKIWPIQVATGLRLTRHVVFHTGKYAIIQQNYNHWMLLRVPKLSYGGKLGHRHLEGAVSDKYKRAGRVSLLLARGYTRDGRSD